MLAAKAYASLNSRLASQGTPLRLHTPYTVGDISKADVPQEVARLGGCACVKVPYGNAGQGVYTITCEEELAAFMEEKHACVYFSQSALFNERVLFYFICTPHTPTHTPTHTHTHTLTARSHTFPLPLPAAATKNLLYSS